MFIYLFIYLLQDIYYPNCTEIYYKFIAPYKIDQSYRHILQCIYYTK